MPYGMYISAEGAAAQSRRLEVLANNLANVNTTGFKRDLAVFQARYAEAVERGQAPADNSLNNIGGGVEFKETLTDYTQGPLQQTGRDLDVAVRGDGFFMVQKNGQQLLTRAGNFVTDPTGQVVTQDGDPVLSDGGSPLVIDPGLGPWQMTADGGIAQAGDVQMLAIVKPQSLGDLVKVGDNLFMPLAATTPLEPGERGVLPGFLEGSGVKPTLEMMELIETSRAFEANVNMVKHQDQAMGTLISRVLKE